MAQRDPHPARPTPSPLGTGGPSSTPDGSPGSAFEPWRYRAETPTDIDLAGYHVEASDGGIGKVDQASYVVNSSYLVVDTGPWLFGRRVMLPAGTISHVDHNTRKVHIDRSKDQIRAAPEYDETADTDPAYRDRLGGYYGDTYAAIPPGTARER